jgi:uncharacterized protein
MPNKNELKLLQPNVGFILRQASGYSRSIELMLDIVELEEDVTIEHLEGSLVLTRTSQGIWVAGTLKGFTPVECGRCLTRFSHELTLELMELFYFPPDNAPSQTEYTVTEDGLLDLVEPVREQVILSTPMSPLCQPGCLGICGQCGQNRNQAICDCKENKIDPRLAALKDLISGD